MDRLFYGDNLEVLRQRIPAESVDLVYLDPPFNSNRNYNVIFSRHNTHPNDATAQIQAFGDTWVWTPVTEQQFAAYVGGELPTEVADALSAFHTLLGENDAMAYLVNMAPRLVELHRALKSTGSLYLHCDPTMSHYLKILLDAIFGAEFFKSEIIWKRTGAHGSAKRYAPLHDVILFYTKSSIFTWNQLYGPHDPSYLMDKFNKKDDAGRLFQDVTLTGPGVRSGDSGSPWKDFNPTAGGRHWALPGFLVEEGIIGASGTTQERLDALEAAGRIYWTRNNVPRLKYYVEDTRGMPLRDVWVDIAPINSQAAERLGYPTQKPVALMERIIGASSNEGDVVLDPFCGCGTTIDAAIRLKRQWAGIDVTYLAVDLINKRLFHTFGKDITKTYDVLGIPRDKAAALALFSHSPFDFERWAVSLVGGEPNAKQVGDKGIDGVARFPLGRVNFGKVLVSVKGGKQLNPSMVRDLGGTVSTQKAEMGVLVTNGPPTKGMIDEANHAGTYQHPNYPQAFPRIQIVTVDDLLAGKRPAMPPTVLPYIQAQKNKVSEDQASIFDA